MQNANRLAVDIFTDIVSRVVNKTNFPDTVSETGTVTPPKAIPAAAIGASDIADLYGNGPSDIWLGYLSSFGVLVALAGLAGFLALRWIKRGSPPTPDLAIEEAKRTREELERQSIERDQLERSNV